MTIVSCIYDLKAAYRKGLFLGMLTLILAGCKKEYQQLPYSEIISFSITDTQGEVLKGAMENNQVLLYWPPEQEVPEFITPMIKLSEGASISPASGTKVPFKEGTAFTVTAQNGKTTVYKIKPMINTVIPYIKSIDGFQTINQKTVFINPSVFSILGDYFNTEKDKTKVFFITKDDKEIELKGLTVKPINILGIGLSVATGSYKAIKLISNDRTLLINRDFVVINDPLPFISPNVFESILTLKRGDRITVTGGRNLKVVNKVEFMSTGSQLYALKIVESTNDRMVIEVPADFPAGQYREFRYSYPASDYLEAGRRRVIFDENITVTLN